MHTGARRRRRATGDMLILVHAARAGARARIVADTDYLGSFIKEFALLRSIIKEASRG